MNNNRNQRYTFTTQRDLITFFSGALPKSVIRDTIREMKKKYVKRLNMSKATDKLQFLKKCEWELVKLSRKTLLNE